MAIKAIGFDQGGIIIGVDYHKTVAGFAALGATNAAEIYTQAEQVDYVDLIEQGKITPDNFLKELRNNLKDLRDNVTDAELIAAWNSIICDLKREIFVPIKELRDQGYITFIYSNINVMHDQALDELLTRENASDLYTQCFHEVYFSYEIGFNKPYNAGFQFLTEDLKRKYNLRPDEILFIDDSAKHIYGRDPKDNEGAIKAGWQGLLVPANLSAVELRRLIAEKLTC